MMNAIQIKQMNHAEKLQVMECIWEDITSDNLQPVQSPDWHKQLLSVTEKRYLNGDEIPVDWSLAKRELRKQFE